MAKKKIMRTVMKSAYEISQSCRGLFVRLDAALFFRGSDAISPSASEDNVSSSSNGSESSNGMRGSLRRNDWKREIFKQGDFNSAVQSSALSSEIGTARPIISIGCGGQLARRNHISL